VTATLAPNDQPDLGSGSATERYRRARLGFHANARDHRENL